MFEYLAEKRLIMPLLLISNLYNINLNHINSKKQIFERLMNIEPDIDMDSFKHYAHSMRMCFWNNLDLWKQLYYVDPEMNRTVMKIWSLTYGFKLPKARTWCEDWVLYYIVDFIYAIVYMVPMPRSLKSGRRWGIRLLGWIRYHKGSIRNNIVGGGKNRLRIIWNFKRTELKIMSVFLFLIILYLIRYYVGFYGYVSWLTILIPLLNTDYYFNSDTGDNSYNGLYRTFQGGSDGPKETLAFLTSSGDASGDNNYFERGVTNNYGHTSGVLYKRFGSPGNKALVTRIGTGSNPVFERTISTDGQVQGYFTWEYINFQGQAPAEDGLIINGNTYATLQFITMTTNCNRGILFEDGDFSNANVNNCTLLLEGIYYLGGLLNHPSDLVIDNCMISGPGGDRIQIHEGTNANYYLGSNINVFDCEVDNNADVGGNSNSIDITSGNNISVYSCEFYNYGEGANSCCFTDDKAYDIEIYLSKFYEEEGNARTFVFQVPHITLWCCEIRPGGPTAHNGMIYLNSNNSESEVVEDVKIVKNTFKYQTNDTYFIYIADTSDEFHPTNNVLDIGFNIFTGTAWPTYCIYFQNPVNFAYDDARLTADKNVWGDEASGVFQVESNGAKSFANWQSAGKDTNGFNENPDLFDIPNNDFHILAGSPAIGLGPGTSTYVPDLDDVNSDNDAGGYEYTGSPPVAGNFNIANVHITNIHIKNT